MAPADPASPELALPEFVREASKLARFVTLVIDQLAIVICITVVGLVLGVSDENTKSPYWHLLSWVMYVLYYVALEYTTARTLGKLVVGTKVVPDGGGDLTFLQILGRTLARYVPFEPISFFLADRGWHDRLSRTRVVRTRGTAGFR
jgi:uncharacterized RDD family membrane protein YckC